MWWSVDEDWVEVSAAAPVKRDSKKKRACKNKDLGYVHAVEPGNSSTSFSASNSPSSSDTASTSIASGSTPSPSSTTGTATSSDSSPTSVSISDIEGERDGIQLNIGRSLVQVAKEGFEMYSGGLDSSWNVLNYPSSSMWSYSYLTCVLMTEYANIRSGM